MTIRRPHPYIAPALLAALLVTPIAGSTFAATTTISSVVSPVITLFTTSTTVNINTTPTASGVQSTASDTVTVGTNDNAGYTLKLADTDTDTNMTSGSNNIAAITATVASPVALTAGKWGWRVDSLGGFGAGPTSALASQTIGTVKYAPVQASSGTADTLKTTATTSAGDVTTVWYSVAVDTTQPSGTYTDQVTYTATAN